MLLLKSIKINNFLSHEKTEISFGESDKLLIDGNSGCGKSSIVDSIIWVLYGKSRTDNRNLVMHGAKKATVTLVLLDNASSKEYKIERSTIPSAKNTLDVYQKAKGEKAYKAVEATGIKGNQTWIETDLLHASYELFINSIAYPQDTGESFVKQTASNRKELLLEIANIKNLDQFYTNAKVLLADKRAELDKVQYQIQEKTVTIKNNLTLVIDTKPLKAQLLELDTQIANAESLKASYQNLLSESLSKKVELDGVKSEISSTQSQKVILEAKQLKKETEIKEIGEVDISSMEAEVAILNTKKQELDNLEKLVQQDYERQLKINALMSDKPADIDYDSEILVLQKELSGLEQQGHSCPAGDKCPFAQPIFNQIRFYKDQIEKKTLLKTKLSIAQKEYTDRLASIPASTLSGTEKSSISALKKELLKLETVQAKLQIATFNILSIPQKREEVEEIKKSITELGIKEFKLEEKKVALTKEIGSVNIDGIGIMLSDISKQKNELNIKKEAIQTAIIKSDIAQNTIDRVSKEAEVLQSGLKNAILEIDELELVKEAFGSKGLKTVVVDYLIPRLEDRINVILSRLSEFSIRLDTQKTSADGDSTIEGLFINIRDPMGVETSFDSFSGGEKVKITIAISEALASLQKCGFRILDEAIIALDRDSTEALVEVLEKIQQQFKQMLCISHLPEVKETFGNRIEVVKINGKSKIK